MLRLTKPIGVALFVSVMLHIADTPRATAQYPYPYPTYQTPANGYLTGAASVIQSQAQFMTSEQQAKQQFEQVRQSRLDTKHKAVDEYLYERKVLPTPEEDRQLAAQQQVERSLHNPPITEIASGMSLNVLLTHLQQCACFQGPNIPLDPGMLRLINVTAGFDAGNAAVLKSPAQLAWPFGLQTLTPADSAQRLRNEVDGLMQKARSQAMSGRADASVIVTLRKDIDQLGNMVLARVADFEPSDYIESKRFLRELSDGLRVLQQPTAQNYLNGSYAAKGNNVSELVTNMTRSGLRFAPALASETAAYMALHSALVQYDIGVHPNSFKVAQAPSLPPPNMFQTAPKR